MSSKVALVTGGSQGIGQATITALARRGVTVAAMARDPDKLNAAIACLPPDDRDRILAVAGDVREETDVARAVQEVIDRFGQLDILVNNAGVSPSSKRKLIETRPDEWYRVIDTNLTGTYLMCREALPHLVKSADAYILNVQSTAAYMAMPGSSLNAASKFGTRALTEALIEEYRNSNVRITSVSPGPVDTAIWTHKDEPPSEAQRAKMLHASDIAEIFVWLLDRPQRMHIPNITVTPWATGG